MIKIEIEIYVDFDERDSNLKNSKVEEFKREIKESIVNGIEIIPSLVNVTKIEIE